MFPSIKTRFPTPDDEIQPQRVIFPSPCLRPSPPKKESVFVKKFEIEINAWEDSPSFALSETL